MNRRTFVSSLVAASDLLARPSFKTTRRVLVMFKCHFDAGFVDTQAAILRRYFDQHYPRAIELGASMRAAGGDRYVWTTGSWLLYSYLKQATPDQTKRMEEAIRQGDVAWHALPFTWQTELLDQSAISGCIGFSQALDKRFGRKTTGAKMTDVPGHTRGLITPLARAGVAFLDIGANSASTPPDVPPLFIWKGGDGAQLTVMYHRTEYGGVVRVPGSDLAVAVEVRDDNLGPHTPEEIRKIYADLRAQFPGAEVRAANLTDIAEAVQPYRSHFPVFTQEIGDTWIHGVASDPTKLARYRECLRVRAGWVKNGSLQEGDARDLEFLQSFALAAEHTWGTDTKTWLDFDHYAPAALESKLSDVKYKTVSGSWVEKRTDIDNAVSALPPDLRKQAEVHLAALIPKKPDLSGLTLLPAGQLWETDRYRMGFDPASGAITHLEDKPSGRIVASANNPLALFRYQTLSKADYDRFLAEYITLKTDWAPKDFGKPNIESFHAASRVWRASSAKVWQSKSKVVVELSFGEQAADAVTAWPRVAYLSVEVPAGEGPLMIDLSWFDKRANRLPEALWLTFQPLFDKPEHWTLSKTDSDVSPFDVVSGGNRHLHALTGPLSYRDAHSSLSIESLDAAVVSLGVLSPVSFSRDQPDLTRGFHYSLFNNGWGTNYVQWFGDDAAFRFFVSLE